MTPMNALFRQARMHPDRTAFTYEDAIWTYRGLLTGAEQLARSFLACGVRPGDRVVLHMSNRPEVASALYACLRIGAIACPTNPRLKTSELRKLFQRLQPALYLGEEQLYPHVETIEQDILAAEKRFVAGPGGAYECAAPWSRLLAGGAGTILPEPNKDAPAVLVTTSGTTGEPKFVTHTPETLAATVEAMALFDLDAEQTVLNACPMVHSSGLNPLLASVSYGAAMVMIERFDPDAVLDGIERHGCTWMLGLPAMFDALVQLQRQRPRNVSSLQRILCAGDVCPIQLQIAFEETFGVPLRNLWGATEVVGSLIHGSQPGAVCRIAPGAEVRLVDDVGGDVASGETGEFLVRGPSVSTGYWVTPERIDPATRDGWYYSGDLMRRGDGDELWFMGRKKEIIIRGGANISPVEVERVLLSHTLVQDAAVFGVPDPVLGQRVAAIVELASGVAETALDSILHDIRQQLADYKAPGRLFAVDVVPRNALGKIDRRAAFTKAMPDGA